MNLFKQVWIPTYKYELVSWLTQKYGERDKWESMNKKQLFAIYFSIRGVPTN